MLEAKRRAVANFRNLSLKHPMSKYLLQFLLDEPDLLSRISFVRNRDYLPDTMLVAELGSPRLGFELELGATQREEVSVVNGQLVRRICRERTLCVNEPMAAIKHLQNFRGRLYVVLAFCGTSPKWYEEVVEPNPALPAVNDSGRFYIDRLCAEVIREQIDLAILAVFTRQAIDEALARRDEAAFRHHAAVYRNVMARCMWEFE